MNLQAGQIIEFLGKESGLSLGVVLSITAKGIRVLLLNKKETTLNERNVLHIGQTLKGSLQDLDYLREAADAIDKKRAETALTLDLESLHSLLVEDPRAYSLKEMADFLADQSSDDQSAALLRRLSDDRMYFKSKKDGYVPSTNEEVDTTKAREKQRLEQEQQEQALITEMKNVWSGSGPMDHSPALQRTIEPLVQVLLHGDEALQAKKWYDLLQKAGISGDRKLFQWLVKYGRFQPDENLALVKYAVPVNFSKDLLQTVSSLIEAGQSFESSVSSFPPNLTCWVIDNESTKDRDDGFSLVQEADGSTILWIHIADAARFIAPDSPLDLEARRRATTIYLPEGNIPMLPCELSEQFLSLNQGSKRATLSQRIHLSPDGTVLDHQFSETCITIQRATDYSSADQLIGQEKDIDLGLALAALLKKKRQESGGLIMPQRPESKLEVEDGLIQFKQISRESPTQAMIAEFMIWANHLASLFCREHDIPCLFRLQDACPENLEIPENFDPTAFFKIIRTLKRSTLSIAPGPHGCLGLSSYTQITSPIRRYGDLLLQRQIKAFLHQMPMLDRETLRQTYMMAEEAAGTADSIMFQRQKYVLINYLKQQAKDSRPTYIGTIVDIGMNEVQIYLDDLCEFSHCRKPPFEVKPGQKVQFHFTQLDSFDLTMKFEIDCLLAPAG